MKKNPDRLLKPAATCFVLLAALALAILPARGLTVLAGWDVGAEEYGGPTNLVPATVAAGLDVTDLLRGSGVNEGSANYSFGGSHWNCTNETTAIASNEFITCVIAPSNHCTVSFAAVDYLSYNRSGTGPAHGALQYSVDGVNFQEAAALAYAGSGTLMIDLSGIAALQNVGYGTNVTLRIVNWGATGATGTWYVRNGNSSGNDFEITGTVTQSTATPVPIPLNIQWAGTNVVLTWTDPAGDFSLQAAPQVAGSYTNVAGTSPCTNAITDAQRFFRLKAN